MIGTVLAALGVALGFAAAVHALLYKRLPQSAFGWIAVCVMLPLGGALLYYLFGINREERRARELRSGETRHSAPAPLAADAPEALRSVAALGERASRLPLLGGNRVTVLHNGEQAYPAMLAAIEQAAERLFVASYIFDSGRTGRTFAAALGAAAARGVEVRVLLDGFGELYSRPPARAVLAAAGVRVGRFLPPRLLPPSLHVNLRNHRKILVADGRTVFTGGINIGDRHLAAEERNPNRVVDVHFRFDGPVAGQIEAVFLDDWRFATGEDLQVPPAEALPQGPALCRAVADGPDGDLDRLRALIVGAIGFARSRVTIMTPYFLPPRELIGVMQAAALRGVEVAVILPGRNNLPYIHRATRHMLWEILERGVRVYYQPPPFVHSKLLLVDDAFALVGSANLDPRSLRLNFELNVEIYDATVVTELARHCDAMRERSAELTLQDVDRRNLAGRILDGVAWLFTPYL